MARTLNQYLRKRESKSTSARKRLSDVYEPRTTLERWMLHSAIRKNRALSAAALSLRRLPPPLPPVSSDDDDSSESASIRRKVKVVKQSNSVVWTYDRARYLFGQLSESDESTEGRRCLSLNSKFQPCKRQALDGLLYCHLHAIHHVVARDDPCQKTTRKTSRCRHTASNESSPKDRSYRAETDEAQCIRITCRGNRCPQAAAPGSICCYRHTQNNDHPSRQGSLTTFAENDSASLQSSEDCVDLQSEDGMKEISESEESDGEGNVESPYRYKEFLQMWKICEEFCGIDTDEIESSRAVREANNRMQPCDSNRQLKAQYGRLLPRAMRTMIKDILKLKRDDVFLDIGHGIGNTCIQAAFTVGCESRGIEVVLGRNSIAQVFRDNLVAQNVDNPNKRTVGEIDLRHGRLEDIEHTEFLTKGVTKAYVNNFNGVFAERSSKGNQKWFLDDYVAALFALMEPNSILVSLHPLTLGPTRSEANDMRMKQGLCESRNASFYEVEKRPLGKACDSVKWIQRSSNQKKIFVYVHRRIPQPGGDGKAVFVCTNPACEFAINEVPLLATTKNEEGRYVINHCECKITTKNLRRQRRMIYSDF